MGRERQKLKKEETRREILDTALKLGMEEGFEQVSIRKITNALGYSAGSVYHYFKDRQEIINTIHEEANLIMKEHIEKIIRYDMGFEYNMRAVFSVILNIVLEEPEKYNLIVLDKYSKRGESISPWIRMMEHTIQISIDKGELKSMDASLASFNLWSSFIGLMIMISNTKGITKELAFALLDNHIDIVLMGINNTKEGGLHGTERE